MTEIKVTTREEKIAKIEEFLDMTLQNLRIPGRIPENIYAIETFANTVHNLLESFYYLDLLKGKEDAAPKKSK